MVKWMNESYFESIFAIFYEKSPFLSNLDTFWAIFWHFSYLTSINDSLTSESNYLLNVISRIFFWIEYGVKQYWIKYWMNHFLAKFKHWIESDWVSNTTTHPSICKAVCVIFVNLRLGQSLFVWEDAGKLFRRDLDVSRPLTQI